MFKKIITIIGFIGFCNYLPAQLDFSQKNSLTKPILSKMDSTVRSGKYENITSILIAQNGKVIYEKYYNGADGTTLHNTRSATKTMATLLTGIAIDKKFIKTEKDKILSYLQYKMPIKNNDKRKKEITIEDLLTMSSMVECNDWDNFSRGHEQRMYIIEDWAQFYLDLPIRSFPFGPKPAELPYGRSFSYCSSGSALVAEIVQAASKMKSDKFVIDYLLKPLDIINYKLHYTPLGTLNTAGGSEYASRDFLKIIQLCLNKGQWGGKQLIPADWIQKATTPKVNAWEGMDYGYLFWLKAFGRDTKVASFAMAGNGGNKIVAFPELQLSVVLTSTNYNNRNAHNYTDELLDQFIVPAFVEK